MTKITFILASHEETDGNRDYDTYKTNFLRWNFFQKKIHKNFVQIFSFNISK